MRLFEVDFTIVVNKDPEPMRKYLWAESTDDAHLIVNQLIEAHKHHLGELKFKLDRVKEYPHGSLTSWLDGVRVALR